MLSPRTYNRSALFTFVLTHSEGSDSVSYTYIIYTVQVYSFNIIKLSWLPQQVHYQMEVLNPCHFSLVKTESPNVYYNDLDINTHHAESLLSLMCVAVNQTNFTNSTCTKLSIDSLHNSELRTFSIYLSLSISLFLSLSLSTTIPTEYANVYELV